MLSFSQIMHAVANEFDIPVGLVTSRRKSQRCAVPRQVCYWLCAQLTAASYPEIARAFMRDHSTVIKGIEALETKFRADKNLEARSQSLKKILSEKVLVDITNENKVPPAEIPFKDFVAKCNELGYRVAIYKPD